MQQERNQQQNQLRMNSNFENGIWLNQGDSESNRRLSGLNIGSQHHRASVKLAPSNSFIHKRNLWIKTALIEKKIVPIVEHLAAYANKYYEPEALMSNYVCSQILCSLLMGPSALEFSQSKTNDRYLFEDPTADDLLRRHKLANPIACLCVSNSPHNMGLVTPNYTNNTNFQGNNNKSSNGKKQQHTARLHNQLERSKTDGSDEARKKRSDSDDPTMEPSGSSHRGARRHNLVAGQSESDREGSHETTAYNRQLGPLNRRNQLHQHQSLGCRDSQRRKPLAIKTSLKGSTLVTDCHHYSCQELSEHQQTKGYTFLSSSLSVAGANQTNSSTSNTGTSSALTNNTNIDLKDNATHGLPIGQIQQHSNNQQKLHSWPPLWSPRMLHETLHQNSRSSLLYAKNNVLLESQPNQTHAGYLSLHQTSSDLILKWIPNQMINGSQPAGVCEPLSCNHKDSHHQQVAIESSYLDLVVCLSVSRIVLVHCQFAGKLLSDMEVEKAVSIDLAGDSNEQQQVKSSTQEESLILVEADGVQRAPFKFPKGGLRCFLSCLESGLAPEKYLDPAIKIDDVDNVIENCNNSRSQTEERNNSVDTNVNSSPLRSPLARLLSTMSDSHQGNSNTDGGTLDCLLRRLPSLKKRSPSSHQAVTASPDPAYDQQQSLSTTPTPEQNAEEYNSDRNDHNPGQPGDANIVPERRKIASESAGINGQLSQCNNYVFRIVSIQQPDWPLQTPPHSALSVGSSSSGSCAPTSGSGSSASRTPFSQRFSWSLSRLARLSARYTSSIGSSSSSSVLMGGNLTLNEDGHVDGDTCQHEASMDSMDSSMIVRRPDQDEPMRLNSGMVAGEWARIEAKLDELKKSASDEILALRTQSVQILCESMKRQIVARAFYGWLVHCRRARIVRAHLKKLIKQDFVDDLISEDVPQQGLTWDAWLDIKSSKRSEREMANEVARLVYYGGIQDDQLRREVWPYLLGQYKFRDNASRRRTRDEACRRSYEAAAVEWIKIEQVVKQRDNELLAVNIARASLRNKLQVTPEPVSSSPSEREEPAVADEQSVSPDTKKTDDNNNDRENVATTTVNDNNKSDTKKRRKARRRPRLESTGSVGSDASITDQFGNNIHRIDKDVQRCDRNFWYFKDLKNLDKLRNVMCSYVWRHLDVGYVQGMCDLAAPFLVMFDDELLAFGCFDRLMERMVANFPHGSAMDHNFEILKHLMQVLDPKLFEILQVNGDYTHFYFCYRWLLLDFKRELLYEDVYKVWEIIWAAKITLTDHFVVFLALAMVRFYRDIIIENNMDFTDTIKFFNEMAERHDAQQIIALARDCIVELQALIKISNTGDMD